MKTTVTTAGRAMPKINRAALMTRAWAIFRQTYSYPAIKFADIGRRCFAGCLRKAWMEAREANRVAAMTAEEKAGRIESRAEKPRPVAAIGYRATAAAERTAAAAAASVLSLAASDMSTSISHIVRVSLTVR